MRPEGATHISKVASEYYKPKGIGEGWMRWGAGTGWYPVGDMAEGTLSLLAPVQTVELEKFDVPMAPRASTACADTFCIRERLIGSKFCLLHGAAPALADELGKVWDALHSAGVNSGGTLPASEGVKQLAERVMQPSAVPMGKCPSLPEPVGVGFAHYFTKYQFVGSRITCNPPPLDTEQDVLVLVHQSNHAVMERKILEAGFVKEGSLPADLDPLVHGDSEFHSYRKGDMNYIVTTDEAFYQRFSTATELARKYNLMEKSDRIQLFQAVLYGKWWA